MRIFAIGTLALLGITAPLQARDWPSAGGWDVVEVGPTSCGMTLGYEGKGETLLVLLLDVDGGVVMDLENYAWSAVPQKEYELAYHLNGTSYEGGVSLGSSNGARKGFITKFGLDFLKDFAASSYLTIRGPNNVLIDDLKLQGSAAGLAQVQRCIAHLKSLAAAEAREKAKFAHIPDDPFAAMPKEGPVKSELKPSIIPIP